MEFIWTFLFYCYIVFGSLVAGQPPQHCDPGWKEFDGGCYLFVGIKSTWLEAINYCKVFESALLEINSPEEQIFVSNISLQLHQKGLNFHQKVAESYWIGLNDIESEGHYFWISDHQPMTIHFWSPGEPRTDPGLNEDCVELAGHFNYKWNDARCDLKIHFICKKESYLGTGIILG